MARGEEDRGGRRRNMDDDDPPRGRDRDRGRDDRDDRDRGGRDRDDDTRGRGRDREDRGSDRGRSGGSRGGYEYHPRSREDVERRSTMGGTEYDRILADDVKMWKPHDRQNTIRPIQSFWMDPKKPDRPAPHYGLDIYVHYGVGPDRASYLCPAKHDKGACPICEERDQVANSDEDYAKQLAPKRRVLFWMIDRDDERAGPQAWAAPYTFDQDVSKVSMDKRTGEVLNIDHAFEGYDIEFEKEGQGARTKYSGVSVARKSSELGDERWLDYARDNLLPEKLVFYDYQTIAKAFGGGDADRSRRERDDGGSRGSRDRDDDRGSSRSRDDSDRGRSDDRRDSGRSSRGRDDGDRPSSRGRDRDSGGEEPKLTWESVHAMTGRELEDLIEIEDLKINPDDAKDDDELADWICEDLKLEKAAAGRRHRATPPAEEEDPKERLRRLREERDGSGRDR